MIDVYYAPTPNGHKITLFLEETGLQYQLHRLDISAGAQFKPAFLAIMPNNKIPAIVDNQPADGGAPFSLFESGAILLYLADKTGQLLSHDLRERHTTLQWLFWQMTGFGPMLGQNTTSANMRPKKSPTPLTATAPKPRGSTACWISNYRSTATSQASSIASPISLPTPGRYPMRSRISLWRTIPLCNVGSTRSGPVRRWNAPGGGLTAKPCWPGGGADPGTVSATGISRRRGLCFRQNGVLLSLRAAPAVRRID
ncbi:putative glutathione S-transferase [Sodalis glossinidius str. 'morsitans']|uniref:Glutathione S-transferase n=1 Tax=Sodalis glossinidius (strain morsitans) TaxID=343509 RepID=Q2NSJ1_SODGM|nr:putative glutathione S-transferase [Sodalis glossinidius str. 'morsitans']